MVQNLNTYLLIVIKSSLSFGDGICMAGSVLFFDLVAAPKLSSIIIFQVGLKCLETLVFLDLKMTHAISVNGLAKPKFKVYSSRNQDHGNWKGRDESKIYNKQLTWVLLVTRRNIRPKVQPTRQIRFLMINIFCQSAHH